MAIVMENIRLCTGNDLQGVLQLYRELRPGDPKIPPEHARQIWHNLLDNPQVKIVVADIGGTLAASCQLSINPTITNGGRPFGIIEHVITANEYRRRNLGQKVLEQALTFAWHADCYKVMLLSGEGREAAHKLYQKVGFKGDIEKGFVDRKSVV